MKTGRARNKNNTHNNTSDDRLPTASLRLLAPPLRLVSAAMWKVMQQRDVMYYGKLEEFVTSVSETVPGLLSYRHQAKLTVGLRARLILEQLRVTQPSDPELILHQLERLHAPAMPTSKRVRADQKVEMAVKNFHTLVQTLLKVPAEREQFFKKEFVSQYGPHYDSALEKLLWEFLTRLDQLLPVPDLAQTVSWLTEAPAVLEECARSASQPQLLRTLLQHERCLGHLNSTSSVPSSTGDSILSSLSLPLSGKVQDSNLSGSTPTPNIIPSSTSPRQKSKKKARESVSHINPVIGSMSTTGILHETSSSASDKDNEEAVTESLQRSCRKNGLSQNVPKEEHCVGKVLITVINQTPTPTSSEVEEEDESLITPVRRSSRKSDIKQKQTTRSGDEALYSGEKKKRTKSSKTSRRNSQDTKQQQEEGRHCDLHPTLTRQLRVIIPRLDIKDYRTVTNKESSPRQPAPKGVSPVRKRKRKLSLAETPEKNLTSNYDNQVYAGSPCIPTLTPVRMESEVLPVAESTDDIIVDSEDEATEKVTGRLFTKRYCKTKSDTYIPTLHEFWTPAFLRRGLLSPGNGCR